MKPKTAWFRIVFCACLVGLAIGPVRPALGEDAAKVKIQSVRVGLGGSYKTGFWTPVWVTLRATADAPTGRLELTTPDSDGIPVIFRVGDQTARLPVGESTVLSYVKFGRPTPDLTVAWKSAEEVVATQTLATTKVARILSPSQPWLVTIGDTAGFEEASRQIAIGGEAITTTLISNAADLPDRWYGFDGVDTIVVTTSREAFTQELRGPRFQALDRWVRLGGRLVLTVGRQGETVFADGSPFVAWSPGRFTEVSPLRRTTMLESYAGASQRLEVGSAQRGGQRLESTLVKDVIGRVEASEASQGAGERPLVVRYPLGLGSAIFVAVDLDQLPLSTWPGRTRLVARILQRSKDRPDEATGRESLGQLTHYGFDDLVGQLHSALDQFSGVPLVPFSFVAGLLVVYIVLIGPADYFLWRWLRWPQGTWVSLAISVTGFVLLAYWLGAQWKEPRLRVNQVDVVDFDATSRTVRGTTWLNIYSPQTQRFDLSIEPRSDWPSNVSPAATSPAANVPVGESTVAAKSTDSDSPTAELANSARLEAQSRDGGLLVWQGVPGKGLGALGAVAASTSFRQPYFIEGQAATGERERQVARLPVRVAGTKSLSGRWWQELNNVAAGHLQSDALDGQLQGDFTAPFPAPVGEWFIVYSNWLYRGDRELHPGDVVSMSDFSSTRYLDWHLTRRRVNTENKDLTTPWDQSSFEVPRIVEMMLFHEAAGGGAYTRLTHRYQPYLDLTEHLRSGRAILIGRSRESATKVHFGDRSLNNDDYDQHWTFYRAVLPVSIQRAANSDRPPARGGKSP